VIRNPQPALLRAYRGLDPIRDYRRIYDHLVNVDSPAVMSTGLNLAFYKTFAAPAIAGLLVRTGHAIDDPRKRAEDTFILMSEMIMSGFGPVRGRDALHRMNRSHAGLGIGNADHLYVLAALAVEPIRFLDRFGGRKALPVERAASAEFYRQLGLHMKLDAVPAHYAAFEQYLREYEQFNFAYTDAAHQLMLATTDLMSLRFPPRLRKYVGRLTATMMDASMRSALGVPDPPLGMTTLVRALYRAQSIAARRRDPDPVHRFPDGVVTGLMRYPDGYEITQVGPPAHPGARPRPALRPACADISGHEEARTD
jgi:hypothetical protein